MANSRARNSQFGEPIIPGIENETLVKGKAAIEKYKTTKLVDWNLGSSTFLCLVWYCMNGFLNIFYRIYVTCIK
jgi:hypothetical protein